MGFSNTKENLLATFRRSPRLAIYLAAAAVCIIALILLRMPDKNKSEQMFIPEPADQSVNYETELEERLKEIISKIKGVSDVTVMVTIVGSEEKVFAADISESDSRTESKTVIAGSKEALLESTKYPEVRGVLVVCRGGNSAAVKEKVVNAVATVLDIPTSKVYVTDAK